MHRRIRARLAAAACALTLVGLGAASAMAAAATGPGTATAARTRVLTLVEVHAVTGHAPQVTVLGTEVVPAAPAVIHPETASCVGSKCNGLDPVTQSNCSVGGGVVLTRPDNSSDANLGTLNLMGNLSCASNWAEADNLAAGVWIEVFNVYGNQSLYQPNYNWGYTNMVNGQNINDGTCIYPSNRSIAYCAVQGTASDYPASVWDLN